MSRREIIFGSSFEKPISSNELPDGRDLGVNSLDGSAQPSLLCRATSSKWLRYGTIFGAFGAGAGAFDHVADALKNAPEAVHRSIDSVLDQFGTQTARADHEGPGHTHNGPPVAGTPPPIDTQPQRPAPTQPHDVCPNISGTQESVPAGKIRDAQGNCVDMPTPTPTPPRTPEPTPTPTPPPPPPDACPNIEGIQTSVPGGLIKDAYGNCVVLPTPTPPQPTSTPPPPEREIQVITKKGLEAFNGNGFLDSGDQPYAQDYKVWYDRDGDQSHDPDEPFKIARTNSDGIRVIPFRGNFGPGDRFCSEEFNVSPQIQVVVGKDCDPVDSSLTVENQLVNRNPLPEATSTPTPTPEATPPPKKVVPPPPPLTLTPTPEAPKPPKVVAPPPPKIEIVVTPTPVIPKTCTLPSGEEVPLPPEFQAKLVGKDAQTIAKMLDEFKCELLGHVEQNTQEHKDIREDIKKHDEEMDKQHGEQNVELGEIQDAVGLGAGEMPIDKQIGVKPGEPSIAERVDTLSEATGIDANGDGQTGFSDGSPSIKDRLTLIWDRVRNSGHDIWDRVDVGASVVGALGALGTGGLYLYIRRQFRGLREQIATLQPPATGGPRPPEEPQPPVQPPQRGPRRRLFGIVPWFGHEPAPVVPPAEGEQLPEGPEEVVQPQPAPEDGQVQPAPEGAAVGAVVAGQAEEEPQRTEITEDQARDLWVLFARGIAEVPDEEFEQLVTPQIRQVLVATGIATPQQAMAMPAREVAQRLEPIAQQVLAYAAQHPEQVASWRQQVQVQPQRREGIAERESQGRQAQQVVEQRVEGQAQRGTKRSQPLPETETPVREVVASFTVNGKRINVKQGDIFMGPTGRLQIMEVAADRQTFRALNRRTRRFETFDRAQMFAVIKHDLNLEQTGVQQATIQGA